MSNITLPMQPDYYKETMKAMFKQLGINPVFEGYRVDCGNDPNCLKLCSYDHTEHLSRVVKMVSPSEGTPVVKWSEIKEKVCISDKKVLNNIKKHYGIKG